MKNLQIKINTIVYNPIEFIKNIFELMIGKYNICKTDKHVYMKAFKET